jgi:hypothetical protein
MSRKKLPEIVVDEKGFRWNLDDFDLDSHGVEAPEREVFEMFAELGKTPDEVNEEIRERYARYLERMKKKKERERKRRCGRRRNDPIEYANARTVVVG